MNQPKDRGFPSGSGYSANQPAAQPNKEDETSKAPKTLYLVVLTIVLILLKISGLIRWSWWVITFPVWGPIASVLVFVVLLSIPAVLLKVLVSIKKRKHESE